MFESTVQAEIYCKTFWTYLILAGLSFGLSFLYSACKSYSRVWVDYQFISAVFDLDLHKGHDFYWVFSLDRHEKMI